MTTYLAEYDVLFFSLSKTTFLDLLCPPSLSDYHYTGKIIYPQEKDVLCLIGQNLIINIDDQLEAEAS